MKKNKYLVLIGILSLMINLFYSLKEDKIVYAATPFSLDFEAFLSHGNLGMNGTAVSFDRWRVTSIGASNALVYSGNNISVEEVPAPAVSSITRLNPSADTTNASSVVYRVTFNQPVIGVDGSDFSLTSTGTAEGTITNVSANGNNYDVMVSGIHGNGTLRLDLKSTGTGIVGSNLKAIESGYHTGEIYTIDKEAPILIGAVRNNDTKITVTLSESSINLTKANHGGFTVSEIGTPSITYVVSAIEQGSDATHVILTVSDMSISAKEGILVSYTQGGNGMIQDTATNPLATNSIGLAIPAWDTTAPVVNSMNGITPSNTITNVSPIIYQVEFSEVVTGIDISDFSLATTQTAAGTVTAVSSGSGKVIEVTIDNLTGEGSLRLDLNNSGTGITDIAGNEVTGGYSSGQSYSIDHIAPKLTPGLVRRMSHTTGTISFTLNEVGEYYFAVVADNASEPFIDTSGIGVSNDTNVTTITNPTGLIEGAMDIYIKAKDKAGNVSKAVKIDIPRYMQQTQPSMPSDTTTIITSPPSGTMIVNVTNQDDKVVTQITVQRMLDQDGLIMDLVTFDLANAKRAIEALKLEGKDTVRIIISDRKEQVSHTKVALPKEVLDMLALAGLNLEIQTKDGIVNIPKESVDKISRIGRKDVYFSFLPTTKEEEKTIILERAKGVKAVKDAIQGSSLSIQGRPITIKTNLTSTVVDVTLPFLGIEIPENAMEKANFLKKLAIFIEHSDGTKKLVRGNVVTLKEGVLGVKFQIKKFSTFSVIQSEQLAYSQYANILEVNTPLNSIIDGKKITATVNYNLSMVKINVNVSKKASFKIYEDAKGTKEITLNQVKLKVGKNKVYLKVTAENGNVKVYSMVITRKAAKK